MGRFDNKVAFVTGGARGMGASHVEALAAEGAKVVAADILNDEGRQLADRLGEHVAFVNFDVTNEHDWDEAIRFAEERFGPLDILVNNAGVVAAGSIEDTEPAAFRRVIDINLYGAWLGMHFGIPSLKKRGGGVIINVSSTAGMMGYANLGAYVSSKWGLRGLTKTAALETGRDGIRVVSVHPGPIATPMTAGMGDEVTGTQPIPRFGTSEEVTKLVLFLAADGTYSTGSEFVIDGGALLGPVFDLSGLENQ